MNLLIIIPAIIFIITALIGWGMIIYEMFHAEPPDVYDWEEYRKYNL